MRPHPSLLAPAGEAGYGPVMDTGTNLTLTINVWASRLSYGVLERRPGHARRLITHGVLVRPVGMSEDEPFLALLVAAMEAWRLNGPRTPHPEPEALREPLGGGGGAAGAVMVPHRYCRSCGGFHDPEQSCIDSVLPPRP